MSYTRGGVSKMWQWHHVISKKFRKRIGCHLWMVPRDTFFGGQLYCGPEIFSYSSIHNGLTITTMSVQPTANKFLSRTLPRNFIQSNSIQKYADYFLWTSAHCAYQKGGWNWFWSLWGIFNNMNSVEEIVFLIKNN